MADWTATASGIEAMLDEVVDALTAFYGAPMAAAILNSRSVTIMQEIEQSVGVRKAMDRFYAALEERNRREEHARKEAGL